MAGKGHIKKYDMLERVKFCYDLMCQGEVSFEIEKQLAARYQIKKRQCELYMYQARKMIAADFRKQKPYYMQELIKKIEALYTKAKDGVEYVNEKGEKYNKVELTTARQCLADIAKLTGLVVNRVRVEDDFLDEETLENYKTISDNDLEAEAE